MSKIHIVTLTRLDRAVQAVVAELSDHGIWTERLASVPIELASFGLYYGTQNYGGDGTITIPAISVCRLRDWCCGTYVSLRDIVRHEYAHAVADQYPQLIRSSHFATAFGAPHDADVSFGYVAGFHLTQYAGNCPAEDFAECFMIFLRDGGRLQPWHDTLPIRQKWRFIDRLCHAIKVGARTL